MTLDDLAVRLDGLGREVSEMRGDVRRALDDGARVMSELRDAVHELRDDQRHVRERLAILETDVDSLAKDADSAEIRGRDARDQRWRVGETLIQIGIAIGGWSVALTEWMRSRGAH